jgi:hypothetical protein
VTNFDPAILVPTRYNRHRTCVSPNDAPVCRFNNTSSTRTIVPVN